MAEEQAIAVNVENRGIMVISGCGHQTIERILQRADTLFDKPIYGLLGGYHLPLSEERNISRWLQFGITGRLPWEPLTVKEVSDKIDLLKEVGIGVVGISPHDTCDTTIAMFRKAFGNSYIDIVVGDPIQLN